MNLPFFYNLLKAAKITAIASFLGGTFLLILYFYHSGSRTILTLGMYYALFAILMNAILLFTLYIILIKQQGKRKKVLRSLILLIMNIPVGFCYACLIVSYNS